jgi:hypothetical protein
MEYCNVVTDFINYTISNPKNINGDCILCSCKRFKNKKSQDPDIVTMYLLLKKQFMEKYLYWFAFRESRVPYETMIEYMVDLTSNSSNMHEVVDDNSNHYRSMVIDALRMNQGYAGECSIVDEEPNAEAIRFFELLEDSDKLLWDGCTNYSKLSVVT